MTSENVQYPVGTIVREYHERSDPQDEGTTTWVLVEDHETTGGESTRVMPTWIALFSDAVGNLNVVLEYGDLPLDRIEKIGVVPGTPAEQEEQVSPDKVVKGDYPRLTMGTRPDGSPWVVHADFGSGVAVNSTRDIWDNKRVITPAQADRKATALKDAVVWVVNGLSQAVEENKAHFAPEQVTHKSRVGIDALGRLYYRVPRGKQDPLPWHRAGSEDIDLNRLSGHFGSGLVELTEMDSITVGTDTDFEAVADFFDGAGFEASVQSIKLTLITKDGKVDVYPGTRVWRDAHRFYVLFKDSTLFVTVRRAGA